MWKGPLIHSTDTIFSVSQNKRVIIQCWYTSKNVLSFKPLHENKLTGLTCSSQTQFITRKRYIEILIVFLLVVTVCNLVGHILPPSSWTSDCGEDVEKILCSPVVLSDHNPCHLVCITSPHLVEEVCPPKTLGQFIRLHITTQTTTISTFIVM
jgi:hypothetical protein